MSPHDVHRRRIEKLRALGVELVALDGLRTRALLVRFAQAFVDPARHGRFLEEVALHRPIDYDRFLRAECVRAPVPAGGSLRWLGAERGARCVRLDRRPTLRALDVRVASIEEVWATSWPGMFVSFSTGRALVVTLDYERIHGELPRAAPYR